MPCKFCFLRRDLKSSCKRSGNPGRFRFARLKIEFCRPLRRQAVFLARVLILHDGKTYALFAPLTDTRGQVQVVPGSRIGTLLINWNWILLPFIGYVPLKKCDPNCMGDRNLASFPANRRMRSWECSRSPRPV